MRHVFERAQRVFFSISRASLGVGYIKKNITERDKQFGTSTTISGVQTLAEIWASENTLSRINEINASVVTPELIITIQRPAIPLLRIGEISKAGGGQFGDHKGPDHKIGNGVDIGLFGKDGQNLGVGHQDTANYDQNTKADSGWREP